MSLVDTLSPEDLQLVTSLRARLDGADRQDRAALTHFVVLALRDCALEELRAELARARAALEPAERWR